MSAIGYQECVQVINGELSLEQAKVEMRRATRVFVRRQANWFKEDDPNIHWFYAGESNLVELIEDLVRRHVSHFPHS
jgi:tRNA dimethylallyltransferase